MVLEAGLCLALDAQACAAAGCASGGVLTPASAMGLVLIERLRRAGLKFNVTESPALTDKQQQQQQEKQPVREGCVFEFLLERGMCV